MTRTYPDQPVKQCLKDPLTIKLLKCQVFILIRMLILTGVTRM